MPLSVLPSKISQKLIKGNCKQFLLTTLIRLISIASKKISAVAFNDLCCQVFVSCVSGFVFLVLCLWSFSSRFVLFLVVDYKNIWTLAKLLKFYEYLEGLHQGKGWHKCIVYQKQQFRICWAQMLLFGSKYLQSVLYWGTLSRVV